MSLFNKLISREAPLIIFEGTPGERAYLARLIVSRFGGAEILCENPLIMRIPRSSSIEEVEEFIVSLKGIGNAAARISTNGEEIHRCLDGGENVMMVSEHDPVSSRPWRKGFLAIKLKLCIYISKSREYYFGKGRDSGKIYVLKPPYKNSFNGYTIRYINDR